MTSWPSARGSAGPPTAPPGTRRPCGRYTRLPGPSPARHVLTAAPAAASAGKMQSLLPKVTAELDPVLKHPERVRVALIALHAVCKNYKFKHGDARAPINDVRPCPSANPRRPSYPTPQRPCSGRTHPAGRAPSPAALTAPTVQIMAGTFPQVADILEKVHSLLRPAPPLTAPHLPHLPRPCQIVAHDAGGRDPHLDDIVRLGCKCLWWHPTPPL
jgi:hypothetical protein